MSGILFDGRWIRPGMTGVGISAYNLLSAIGRTNVHYGVISCHEASLPIMGPNGHLHRMRIDLDTHPVTEIFEQMGIPILCWIHGYSNFVSFEGRVPLLHPGIGTYSYIQDLSILKLPSSHSLKYVTFLKMTLLISRLSATQLITGSETVKSDIVKLMGTNPKRILVWPHADSGLNKFREKAIPDLGLPFFLSVGMTNPRKNLDLLLDAFQLLHSQNPSIRLYLTGNPAWLKEKIEQRGKIGVTSLGFVSEGELLYLFRHAEALIYPSKDEGFGIPLVDAWKEGCPVLCSDIPVFHEIMGQYADYFNCESANSLASKLKEHKGRISWVERTPPPIEYSWERTAALLIKALINP